MLVIRNDGLGELYPHDTDAEQFLKEHKATHFAVKTSKGFKKTKELFISKVKGCSVVEEMNPEALLFTEEENMDKYPFYLTGFYGETKSGKPITKIVTQSVLTQTGNRFKIYRTPEMVKMLLVESKDSIGIDDIKHEAKVIGNMLRGIGLTAGLAITPKSVGILI